MREFKLSEAEIEETVDQACARLIREYPYLQEVDYQCLTSMEEVREYLAGVPEGVPLSIDFETTGLNPATYHIVGVALSYTPFRAVYIPVAHTTAPEMNVPWDELRVELSKSLEVHPALVFHYKFEKNWADEHGLFLDEETYIDAMPATYVHDINLRQPGLKYKSKVLLGINQVEFNSLVSKAQLKQGITFANVHPLLGTLYAAGDADLTLRLWHMSEPSLEEQKLVWKIENGLQEVLRVMENNKMYTDKELLLIFQRQLVDQRERSMRRIFEMVGHEFDINSSQQVGKILFDELGITPPKFTKKGAASTDAHALELVENEHPVATEIGYFRRVHKQLATYVQNFLRGLSPDEEARFSLISCKTVTGRLAGGGSESDAESPTYEETGYTEINAQAILATGKINKHKVAWVIEEFTDAFDSACEAKYLEERLKRHQAEWIQYESDKKIKEEWSTPKWKEWKKSKTEEEVEAWVDAHGLRRELEGTKSKKLTVRLWRIALARKWRAEEAREEWKQLFFTTQRARILKEYNESPGKRGCIYANPEGWGRERTKRFLCSKRECECIAKGNARGFEIPEDEEEAKALLKTVDRKELPPIRQALRARPGFVYAAIDYSGVEYRVAGNLSQEPLWINEFLNNPNPDPHSATAEGIFQKSRLEIIKEERDIGKTVNFTILFGGGGYTIAKNIGNGMAPEKGEEIRQKFFRGAPKLHKFIQQTHREIKTIGYVKTKFGRKRMFPDGALNPFDPSLSYEEKKKVRGKISKAERDAFSTKVQGTAADIMKFSLLKLHKKIKEKGWEEDVKMLLTVHDEVVFEIRETMLDEVLPVLVACMTQHNIKDWKIPLVCDIEIGPNWSDTEEYRLVDGRLVKTSVLKKQLAEEADESPQPPSSSTPPEEDRVVALLLSFDRTIDNLKRFRETLKEAPGELPVRVMFDGFSEEIELDERVDKSRLLTLLKERDLAALIR